MNMIGPWHLVIDIERRTIVFEGTYLEATSSPCDHFHGPWVCPAESSKNTINVHETITASNRII